MKETAENENNAMNKGEVKSLKNEMEQLNIVPTIVEEGAKARKPDDANTVDASTTIQNKSKQIELQKKTRSQKPVAERAEEIMKHYGDVEIENLLKGAEKDTLKLGIWDYGGQEIFYAVHHLFLTRFGVYL